SKRRPRPSASPPRRRTATGPTPGPGSIKKSPAARRPLRSRLGQKKKIKNLWNDSGRDFAFLDEPISANLLGGVRVMTEQSIFTAALEKSGSAERTAFLDEVCGGDAVLRRRVEALLHSHAGAGDFLRTPAVRRPVEVVEGRACGQDTQSDS